MCLKFHETIHRTSNPALWYRKRVHRLARAEVSLDAVEIADTNLNVVLFAESGIGIQFIPLPEDPSDGVKWLHTHICVQGMSHFHHGAVQSANENILLFSQWF